MHIDKTDWGVNLLAMAMKQKADRVIFRFRSWRPALVLVVLMGIFTFFLFKLDVSAGSGIMSVFAKAIPVALFLLGLAAVVIFLYRHEVIFDFSTRQAHGRRSLPGWKQTAVIPFDRLVLQVAEEGTLLSLNTGIDRVEAHHGGWDVKILDAAQRGQAHLSFWRAARREEAEAVAGSLARAIGCEIKTPSAP